MTTPVRIRPPDGVDDEVEAFVADLFRLESQVREVTQQLDRLEAEVSYVLAEMARAKFEGYR